MFVVDGGGFVLIVVFVVVVVVVIVVFDGAFVVGDDLVVVVGDRVFEDADAIDDAVVIFGDLVETRDVGIVGKSVWFDKRKILSHINLEEGKQESYQTSPTG